MLKVFTETYAWIYFAAYGIVTQRMIMNPTESSKQFKLKVHIITVLVSALYTGLVALIADFGLSSDL